MTAALTPQLALAYLGELTVDVRVAVVLGPDGAVLAGDAALAARANALPAVAGVQRAADAAGTLVVARAAAGAAIAVVAGDRALLPLLEGDLARIAAALALPDFPS